MSDVMKMDELLGTYQQSLKTAAAPAALPADRDPAVMRRTVIVIGALCYGLAAIGMISYALTVAAQFGK
ncbi:hypothetical protein BH11PSE4_BH11PSE4_24440 [soil metagenome]